MATQTFERNPNRPACRTGSFMCPGGDACWCATEPGRALPDFDWTDGEGSPSVPEFDREPSDAELDAFQTGRTDASNGVVRDTDGMLPAERAAYERGRSDWTDDPDDYDPDGGGDDTPPSAPVVGSPGMDKLVDDAIGGVQLTGLTDLEYAELHRRLSSRMDAFLERGMFRDADRIWDAKATVTRDRFDELGDAPARPRDGTTADQRRAYWAGWHRGRSGGHPAPPGEFGRDGLDDYWDGGYDDGKALAAPQNVSERS